MKSALVILVLCSAMAAQDSGARSSTEGRSSGQAATKSQRKGAQAGPDEGNLSGSIYTEKFFNLTCTVPSGWLVKTAAMREGLAGQENSILLLSAFAKDAPEPGDVNASLTITAENLAAYPDVKSADDYFGVISQLATDKGFTVLNEPAELDIAGVTFLRGDFQKEEGGKVTYQASMVALRNGYALAVTAISGNDEELTPLLNRVRVFAPPTLRKQ